MSKRVSFGTDSNEKPPTTTFNKAGNRKRVIIGVWSIRLSKSSSSSSSSSGGGFSAERFLKRIGAKVARALSFMSMKRSSRKVSSSSLPRSRSFAEPLDSHRAEAIEDCIEFLNSSSCLQKSNSIS